VRAFHRTYYRPDNAVLIVVGDLQPRSFDAWVDRTFGRLPAPDRPVPRVRVTEPPRRPGEPGRERVITAPQVPLPAVALVWPGPPASHADAPALAVAQALLAGGDSARLTESLVEHDRLAREVGFWVELFADAGLLAAYAVAAQDRRPEALVAGLRAQIRRLVDVAIRDDELLKVRSQLLTQALLARQTPQGRADAIGRAALLLGDARAADRELVALQAVTAADVRRVVRHHLLRIEPDVLFYRQGHG
jgi:zinc protease